MGHKIPPFREGDMVRFKRVAMPPMKVDGFVADANGRIHAACSRDGKGCGCYPVSRLTKAEGR